MADRRGAIIESAVWANKCIEIVVLKRWFGGDYGWAGRMADQLWYRDRCASTTVGYRF